MQAAFPIPGFKARLTRKERKRNIHFMARLCDVLGVLLLLLTFNAYACVLPLQPPHTNGLLFQHGRTITLNM